MITLKINNGIDREKAVCALANAGYFVTVEAKQAESNSCMSYPCDSYDYYVVVEEKP